MFALWLSAKFGNSFGIGIMHACALDKQTQKKNKQDEEKDQYSLRMTKITEDLLRKRSEHNDGMLSTLREIGLHQFEIEKIELVGDMCKSLEILYLQNNLIEVIENIHKLKLLRYLNLAVNSVQQIQNLEGCESLEKLDLTANFVQDLRDIKNLKSNVHLKDMYLIGNPCTSYKYYRQYVAYHLPQLNTLDGEVLTKSDLLVGKQKASEMEEELAKIHSIFLIDHEESKKNKKQEYNEKGEPVFGNDPESRKAAVLALQATREKNGANDEKKQVDASALGEVERLGTDDGRPSMQMTPEEEIKKFGKVMQRNEGKWNFKFADEGDFMKLKIPFGKYLSSACLDVDLQPSYVRILAKGKLLQLRMPCEIKPDLSSAERSIITGELCLKLKKENPKDTI